MAGGPWPPTTLLSSSTTKTPKAVTLPSTRAAPVDALQLVDERGRDGAGGRAPTRSWRRPGRTTTSPTVEANSAVKLRLRVSVKTSEPATNATPSTIANVLISRRSLRPEQALERGAGTSAQRPRRRGHPGHDLEHAVAVGVAQLVDDPAVGEEDHAVGVRRRDRVVGDHHDGLAVVVDAAAEQVEHLGARLRVEVAGGLVGEDDPRPADQRPGHGDPLLLAAGELVGLVVQPVAEADGVDDRVVPLAVGLAPRDRPAGAGCSPPRSGSGPGCRTGRRSRSRRAAAG